MKVFKKILCRLLVVALLCTLCGCSMFKPAPTIPTGPMALNEDIDWTLHGVWINEKLEVLKTVDFTISGNLDLTATGEDSMTLDISFPDSVPYNYTEKTEFVSHSRKYFGLPYCVSTSYSFRRLSGDPVISYFVLCPEKEYVLFYWKAQPDRYLVASTDPETDPAQIVTYFEASFEKYITSD